jgi:Domain of unknown function (DUF1906)
MSIIDTPANTTSKLACLKSKGVTTVIRYYNFRNSQQLPDKRLDPPEAQALAASGMEVAVVFQQGQNSAAAFSDAQGFKAGLAAFRHARTKINQPAGSGIYFSVDFDASTSEVNQRIVPYFQGVRRAFSQESGGGPSYRVGVYGSGLVSSILTAKALIELTWLAMSRGFRGTKEALQAGQFHLAQVPPEKILCGLDVDFNDPNPARPDFGAFTIAVAHAELPVATGTVDVHHV